MRGQVSERVCVGRYGEREETKEVEEQRDGTTRVTRVMQAHSLETSWRACSRCLRHQITPERESEKAAKLIPFL